MASLYNRATPSQARVLRIIEGAIKNACDAHPEIQISPRHRRSIAKRAAGTLTAQCQDVLAAKPSDRGPVQCLCAGPQQRSEFWKAVAQGDSPGCEGVPLLGREAAMVERVARAAYAARRNTQIDPHLPWATWEELSPAAIAKEIECARAGMTAMKYVDGTDEDVLIEVSNAERVEAVTLVLAWDALLDAHLDPTRAD